MKIQFDTFNGEIPLRADHRLPHTYAKMAQNAKLTKDDLRTFKGLEKTTALSLTTVKSIYRHEENSNQHWVESGDVRHYFRSPISGDQYERAYYSDGSQPYFFANDNISGGGFDASADKYKLGIPAPTNAPTVGSGGGGSTYRAYVYAFVNSYGEEGPPSPIDSISDYNTGYVTLDSLDSAPADRAIDKVYVYRTNSSDSGTAEFQYVLEATWFSDSVAYAIGDYVIYSDDLYKCTTIHPAGAWDAGHFTQGENEADADLLSVYPKTNYDPPPADIKGFTVLSNGSVAGFKDNRLYLSEPYLPHAWPTDYIIAFDATIVGIASEKNYITVATEGYPYVVYGTHPSTMQKTKISRHYPGMNIRAITRGNGGVFFVTREGLIFSRYGEMVNITQKMMDSDNWAEYTLSSMHVYFFENKFFAFDLASESGFFIDFSLDEPIFCRLSVYTHAAHVTEDGYFFWAADDPSVVNENDPPANMPLAVFQWEGATNSYLLYTWDSGVILLDVSTNFSVAKVLLDYDFYNDIIDLIDLEDINSGLFAAGLTGSLGVDGPLGGGHELAGDELYTLGSYFISDTVTFKLFVDGSEHFSKDLTDVKTIFRMPKDLLSDRIYIEMSGQIPVQKVVIATSPDELL